MTILLVKKIVTSYEFMTVSIPKHNDINDCDCKQCCNDAIFLAIKKDDWYTNGDEFETKYEATL